MNDSPPIQAVITCPVCRDLLSDRSGLCVRCGALIDTSGSAPKAHGMTCFSCGHQADSVGDRCPACGRTYSVECDGCGEPVPIAKRNCPACGHDLAAAAHERVAAARSAPPVTAKGKGINWLYVAALAVVLAPFPVAIVYEPDRAYLIPTLFGAALVLVLLAVHLKRRPVDTKRIGRRRWRIKGELVEVYSTFDLFRAEYLVEVLRSENVPAFLHSQLGTTMVPYVFRGSEVMVPVDRAADAIGIMKAFGFDPDIELDDADQTAPDSSGR